jgi:hypothetical protein
MKTTKRIVSLVTSGAIAASLLALPGVAAAQQAPQGNCPPGSWFCAETPQPAQPAAPAGGALQPLPPQGQPANPPNVVYQQAPPQQPPIVVQQGPAPPPVVVYQPAPPPVMVVQPANPPTPAPYAYTPRPPQWRREWGLNVRGIGSFFPNAQDSLSWMGGFGAGLRYKPTPWFGVQGDFDFLWGRDYNSYDRQETAFSVNTLFFLTPKSKAQLYLLAGLGGSSARVDRFGNGQYERWGYFGAQGGVGIELRLSKHFALNFDVRGFIRGRIDSDAKYYPEFVDPKTGQATNASGGGLMTGGATFYF